MGHAQHMPESSGAAGGTILVVEDDVILRVDTCEYLRTRGYHVIEAGTAEEAMAVLASREAVGVVFCDVQLPGMGGLTFTVWAREHFPDVQIILTSGNAVVTENVVPGRPVPFVPKPYVPADVVAQILLVLSDPGRRAGT